jgi:hypothetical protein
MRYQLLSVVVIVILVAVIATAFVGLGTATEPATTAAPLVVVQPAKPAPAHPAPATAEEPARPGSYIEQVALDGQDVADVFNLRMWKFRLRLPKGPYSCYVWQERWTRDAAKPAVSVLFDEHQTLDGADVVLKLPLSAAQPQQFVRIGTATRFASKTDVLAIESPYVETLSAEEVQPGKDLYLITFTQNKGENSGGRKDVHKDRDVTIYIKARFIPGPYTALDLAAPPAEKPAAPPPAP